jgi:hypothetical protein
MKKSGFFNRKVIETVPIRQRKFSLISNAILLKYVASV